MLFYPDIGMEPTDLFSGFARLAPVQCVTFGHPVTRALGTWIFPLAQELDVRTRRIINRELIGLRPSRPFQAAVVPRPPRYAHGPRPAGGREAVLLRAESSSNTTRI